MKINNKLNSIIEKLIDFDNINVGFKVEFKEGGAPDIFHSFRERIPDWLSHLPEGR